MEHLANPCDKRDLAVESVEYGRECVCLVREVANQGNATGAAHGEGKDVTAVTWARVGVQIVKITGGTALSFPSARVREMAVAGKSDYKGRWMGKSIIIIQVGRLN